MPAAQGGDASAPPALPPDGSTGSFASFDLGPPMERWAACTFQEPGVPCSMPRPLTLT